MANHPRDDRLYSSIGKQRRSSPVGDTGGFFSTGQGGRTVLPPLSSTFPPTSRFPVPQPYSNQYAQPRSSPGRYDYNNQAMYNQWSNAGGVAPQPVPSYNYEYTDPRYTLQPSYSSYPTRTSPTIPDAVPDSRRLAPLQTGRDDKQWQYPTMSPNNHIRSPTASYPNQYLSEQSHSYPYPSMPMNHTHHVPSMNPHHPSSMNQPRMETRAASPYNRGGPTDPASQPYTPPPVSPTTEEPMIKKKRKRADAGQLKVLNDVYNRTAFPSTEERLALAKQLDMSPRSVQIWFQNKRQSMRQTNRQSSTLTSTSHQPFSIASGQDTMVDEMLHSSNMGYGSSTMSVAGSSYGMTRASPDPTRSMMHSTSPTIAPRRPGSTGDDARKWNSRGY